MEAEFTMSREEPKIKVQKSNRIVNESLDGVDGLVFEKVYRQADWTLSKMIDDNNRNFTKNIAGSGKDEEEMCLNVLAFLGGRGRGKTSAMCSFFSYLNKLQNGNGWSKLSERNNIKFLTIPYIDAAMLAEAEYIIDVILAEMWDEFAKYVNGSSNRHDVYFERLERDIKQEFINVRKAYLVLKEREEGQAVSKDLNIPVPTALHELAASINLRQELQQLIGDYLEIFRYDAPKEKNDFYLVIAIDDVDMSGRKAHFILEQVRRFLCMQKVIVLVTADIDRLQLACESRYKEIYSDDNNRRKFINEYLEKVLPYNMRIYMPEIKERHNSIPVETAAKEELGLECDDEKNMILECIARRCGIYFDGYRRKRHFLQNQSMRSMVNYFEQMVRMKDDYLAWLKIDLKERIIERIVDTEQKEFMNELLSKDYEEVNGYVITYLATRLPSSFYGYYDFDVHDRSVGQALYLCRTLEENDTRNAELVNAVIMLYSIIMKHVEEDKDEGEKLWQSVIGGSLWGEQEYGLISLEGGSTPFFRSFDIVGKLDFVLEDYSQEMLRALEPKELFHKLADECEEDIMAWMCVLLFVDIGLEDEGDGTEDIDFNVKVERREVIKLRLPDDMEEDTPAIQSGQEVTHGWNERYGIGYNWEISLQPRVNARKTYLTNAFCNHGRIKNQIDKMFTGALMGLADWVGENAQKDLDQKEKEELVKDRKEKLFGQMRGILETRENKNRLENNIEIIYGISQVLSRQAKTYEFEPREAYSMLVSSYKIIEKELKKRDRYFKEDVRMGEEPGFAQDFMDSPQAKVLLQPDLLPVFVRDEFERKLGELLVEYRTRTTVTKNRTK